MTWVIENKGYTQRRACGLVGKEPRAYRYRSSRPDDTGLRKRLRELAAERRRFGYRRLHLLLKREGCGELDWSRTSNRSGESIARRNALPALSRGTPDSAQTR